MRIALRATPLAFVVPLALSALSALATVSVGSVGLLGCRSASDSSPTPTGGARPTPSAAASGTNKPRPDAASSAPPGTSPLIVERPYRFRMPHGAEAGTPMSLVVLLHGFGGNAVQIERMSSLDDVADSLNIALAAPDGTPDSGGRRFWNATDSCCNFEEKKVDDVAYLSAVIDDASKKAGVDPRHVYVMGHSNGGFMALRLACDVSQKIAAVVSLAGAGYADPTRCKPSFLVSVLDIHGDADRTIPYTGGLSTRLPDGAPFASAKDTAGAWGTYDGCTGALKPAGHLDITEDFPATETDKVAASGCPAGVGVELWTVKGADHTFTLSRPGVNLITGFLAAHPKP